MTLLTRFLEWFGVLLYHFGAASYVIRARPNAVRVLLYHACEPTEDDFILGLASNVTPAHFAEQMHFAATHYHVIPIAELDGRPLPPCASAITFDDGYRSVLEYAAPILERFGLPYTVYLVTDVIGNPGLVWVNELNWLLRRYPAATIPIVSGALGGSSDATAPALIEAVQRDLTPARIATLVAEARRRSGVDTAQLAAESRLYLDWNEIHLMRGRGASFGNHTASHPSLSRHSDSDACEQVVAAHRVLVAALGGCESFAHPFGDVSAAARDQALVLGYRSVMNVGGAQQMHGRDRIARVPAPDGGAALLFARIEVVEPLKAWVRQLRLPGR